MIQRNDTVGVREILYVFLGGGAGSVLRHAISVWLGRWSAMQTLPIATFVVNIAGSFLIGVLAGYFLRADSSLKLLLVTGFCGGFTTFSTFSVDNVALLQSGNYDLVILNIGLSVAMGILAVLLGLKLAG